MEYLYFIQSYIFDFLTAVSSIIGSLGTIEGFVYFAAALAIVPRNFLFLSGRLARFFKVPRLVARAYNGTPLVGAKNLVVLIAGVQTPRLLFSKAARVASDAVIESDILKIRSNFALFSNADPNEMASQIGGLIDAQYNRKFRATGEKYDKIILVGHSIGALWLRKAVLNASAGFGLDRPGLTNKVASTDAEWRTKLDRIIFLAGVNSGFDRNFSVWTMTFTWFLEFLGIGKLLLAMERGTPFVETLRLEWMRLIRSPFGLAAPFSVQLIGDADWAISIDNDIDLEAQVGEAGNINHSVIDVGGASHISILDMTLVEDSDLLLQSRRAYCFIDALCLSKQELRDRTLRPHEEIVGNEARRRAAVKRVIFLYDDNRNQDLWIEPFGFASKRVLGERDDIFLARASVPHLSRFSFLLNLFGRRERALRWWSAKFTELCADHPNATISVVALANGSWVIGRALSDNRAMRVQTIFLSGSILPRDFNWDRIVKEGRLGIICNTLSSEDLYISVFGGLVHWLRENVPFVKQMEYFSLGDSGMRGFDWVSAQMGQISYLAGPQEAFFESRSAIRFAAAFAAFGGPMVGANKIAVDGFNSIQNDTDPNDLALVDSPNTGFVGDAAKPMLFMNRFAWLFGTAIIAAIVAIMIGSGILLYNVAPIYELTAAGVVIVLTVLILDSL